MKDAIFLIFELSVAIARLLGPGGSRAIIAENLLLKLQLLVHNRATQRAPNLSVMYRTLFGFWTLFLSPRRIARSAILIKPSTLLRFHTALKKRKYRLLYSPRSGRKPGPKGPGKEVITAIV
jgi:putative transposase